MLFSSFWKRGPGPPLWGPGGVLGPLDPPWIRPRVSTCASSDMVSMDISVTGSSMASSVTNCSIGGKDMPTQMLDMLRVMGLPESTLFIPCVVDVDSTAVWVMFRGFGYYPHVHHLTRDHRWRHWSSWS